MKISASQAKWFWRLWANACRSQGWDKLHGFNSTAVDAKRKEFLARCGFQSLKDVDPRDDFSLVKRELLKLDDQLQGALEEIQPQIETARSARWFIENDLIPCLALYVEDAPAYVLAVATDKFRWCTREAMERPITLDDLTDDPIVREVRGELRESASQLEQLKFTLVRCLNGAEGLRNQAGDSIHEMRTRARLYCGCARCRKSAVVTINMAVAGQGEEDPF